MTEPNGGNIAQAPNPVFRLPSAFPTPTRNEP
jgi:hypothetical protein